MSHGSDDTGNDVDEIHVKFFVVKSLIQVDKCWYIDPHLSIHLEASDPRLAQIQA